MHRSTLFSLEMNYCDISKYPFSGIFRRFKTIKIKATFSTFYNTLNSCVIYYWANETTPRCDMEYAVVI